MVADADGAVDAETDVKAIWKGEILAENASETDLASHFPDAEALAAFFRFGGEARDEQVARLKEVSMGYAADAARCLRAVVAASAEDAATAAR